MPSRVTMLALTRLASALGNINMGHFIPDYTAYEDMIVKQDLFSRLDSVIKRGAILATNTSTLDIDQVAAVTRRPDDVLGTHFFSPANVMRLLEVVRGKATAKDVLATTMKLGKTLRKVPVATSWSAPTRRG